MFKILRQWDRELFVRLNSLGNEKYDLLWVTATQTETWIPLYLFFVFLIFYQFNRLIGIKIVTYVIVGLGITLALTNIVKYFVARIRPSGIESWHEFIRILQTPSNYSFFSGHASSSFMIVTFLVLVFRRDIKWIYLCYIWPILFSFSRIYVGVHYPLDIIVGATVGIFIAISSYFYYKRNVLASTYKSRQGNSVANRH